MNRRLSVAIPTCNRPDSIHKRICEFRKYAPNINELWISDNSSSNETEIIASSFNSPTVHYNRNSFNIGGGANFMKALTLGKTDYVWLRGDDDPLTDSQVNSVINNLASEPDIIILSRHASKVQTFSNIHDFFKFFNQTQSAGWLSMLVFKQSSLESGLMWGFWGIYTGWSNISLLMGILLHKNNTNLRCLIVPVIISSEDFREEGRKSRKWSVIKTCVDDFPLLFKMLPSSKERAYAHRQWRKSHSFNLARTYLRSRLGLAPVEYITTNTFLSLFSLACPKSTTIVLTILLIRLIPRPVLAFVFTFAFETFSVEKLSELELSDLAMLSPARRFTRLRELQKSQILATRFL